MDAALCALPCLRTWPVRDRLGRGGPWQGV